MQAAVPCAINDLLPFSVPTTPVRRAGTVAAVRVARVVRVSPMTQPPCQVRILTPESSRFERLRARLDQAEPDLLRASCRHWRVLPPPDARNGDVFLIDHQPAAGRDGLRLTRRLRADGGRQPVVLLLPPGTPPEAGTLAEARLAGAADCLPDERADAFVLPRVVRAACAQAEADAYAAPACSEATPCERARLLECIVRRLGSSAGRIDTAGSVVSLVGSLEPGLLPDGPRAVGRSAFQLFPDGAPFLRRTLAGEDTMFFSAHETAGGQHEFNTSLFFDEAHQRSVVFLRRNVTGNEARSARALAESRHQFQMLLERSLDAILLVDDHGQCIEANGAAGALLGYPPGELAGRYTDEIGLRDLAPPPGGPLAKPCFQSAASLARSSFTRPDGQVRLFEYAVYRAAPHLHLCILRDMTGQRRLEREILEVSDREQQRFSEDLHDGLGQHLAGVGYMLGALATRLRSRGAPEAAEAGQIGELIGAAVAQTREIARGIYPPDLTSGRLPDVLARLAVRFQTVYGTFCTFEEDGCEHLPDLPRPSLLHLYRIAHEATSNAHRHGRADAVAIRLAYCDNTMTLTVRDDGRGFDPAGGEEGARQSGLGLHMMHYRAHLLGGTLTVRPGLDGAGTLVTCVFDPALDQDRACGRTT